MRRFICPNRPTRPPIVLPLLILITVGGLALSARAQPDVNLTIFYDEDNLTIYIPPGPELVSLVGLTFDVTTGGQSFIYPLAS
ncbi:MAG: hypothetical protein GYB67_01875, partial [Chloroflexi bacterium]|nr:hypothetical protein [Chloroflexota bacterium]